MKTNYDVKQKCVLMSIALMASAIMLGLNACQNEADVKAALNQAITTKTDG